MVDRMKPVERVLTSPAAAELVGELRRQHGEVMFFLSHGCCDGSTPMCLGPGELNPGPTDVRLGTAAGAPFWISASQRDYLANLELTLDVAPGNNGAFSLEDGSGQRFVLRLRLFEDAELAALAAQPALPAP
ncbi:MAG: hypothetical protein RL722_789 [Pseudomonadota bacterium]|jgi:uncharacterized protein (DUF779 family)